MYKTLPTAKSTRGDVAALLRSHMIGLLPFENTIEETTEVIACKYEYNFINNNSSQM